MKEFLRKKVVGLKRNPQIISLIFVIITCLIYTCSLSDLSFASINIFSESVLVNAEKIAKFSRLIGMYMFIVTLFSILSSISYLSAFKGGKRNNFIITLVYVMLGIMLVCDILFISSINYASNLIINGSAVLKMREEFYSAIRVSTVHAVFLVIDAVLIALVPLFKKWFNLINTEVEDEYDKLIESETDEERLLELQDET